MTERVQGSCHCGAQRFAAPAPETVTHCNCSTCTKRGTLAAYYAPGDVELELTLEILAAYQWGDRMMTFHHCTACGCAVFAESGAWTTDEGEDRPPRITLNAHLFDDFDLEAVPVRVVDGRHGW
ncbi:GFA family protein [Brevundimonas sp.]|uniref:GFA family protein n=1 Tax=Brevundimonas sp. TaxID=1871086 RepID=UPI002D52A2E7|nr:GFA family protein [Brevundimonas sp.]HYD27528.1 GFA family protein [Brevundimonas sp.]